MQVFKYGIMFLFILVTMNVFAGEFPQGEKPIEIGVIYDLTGTEAPATVSAKKGILLAQKNINEEGGVLGRPIKLVIRNSNSDADTAIKVTRELANDSNIFALLGFTNTYALEYAAPIIVAAKKIIISTGSSSPFITKKNPKYLFLISFTDNVQAAAAAEFIYNYLHSKNTAVLYESDRQYGENLYRYFTKRYTALKGNILITLPFKHGDNVIAEQIKKIKALKTQPDCIFLAYDDPIESSKLVKTLREAHLHQPIVGGDGLVSQSLIEIAKGEANNVSFMTHGIINSDLIHYLPGLMRQYLETEKFFTTYKDMYGEMPTSVFATLAYDSLYFLAAAINLADKLDTNAVLHMMHTMEKYVGVTGEITYNHGRTNPIKTVSIVTILNNEALYLGNWIPTDIPPP